jgi:hypothetical protein
VELLLISTTDLKSERQEVLRRMIDSVMRAQRGLPRDRIRLELLVQNCTPAQAADLATALPDLVTLTPVDHRLSLSAARNRVLARVVAAGAVPHDGIVAFPDDDCWYPDGFLPAVAELFRQRGELDFWFCRYASRPAAAPDLPRLPAPPALIRNVVRSASSNTIFLRGRVALATGLFDERLGLGTANASGEDTEYALRALRHARLVTFHGQALVGHRDMNPALVGRYYRGALIAIAQHLSGKTAIAFGRKILVGVYLVLRGRLGVGEFLTALRLAVFRRSPATSTR